MGLDMYLNAETFFWNDEKAPKARGKTVMTARTEVAYWRKANQIHNWFVKNIQNGVDDCDCYYADRDKLRKLLEICRTVKAGPVEKAAELLPTTSGFFFGSTDYDDWYFEQIDHTIKMLEECLNEKKYPPKHWDFYYSSSW